VLAALVVSAGAAVQVSVIDVSAGVSEVQAIASAVTVIVLAAVGGQTWLILHLFKQHGRLLLRMDELEKSLAAARGATQRPQTSPVQGLPLGAPALAFQLPTLGGQSLALQDLLSDGKSAVLIFSDPSCGPCTGLLPKIGRWQRDYAEKVRIVLVSRGTEKANRAKTKQHGVRDVLLQKDREVAELYQANGTPAAVLVRADGAIGSRVAAGSEAITSLVALAAGVPAPTASTSSGNGRGKMLMPMTAHSGLPIGEVAPPVTLPDLTGYTVSLSDFKGRKTLVLFWNPGCGFCQRMLPDLKAWEENRSNGSPELLLISTGAVEANQKMGLRSAVLLDAASAVARQFRGGATPSAVLIDDEGRIASELAVGAPSVLALAGMTKAKAVSPTAERQERQRNIEVYNHQEHDRLANRASEGRNGSIF
jgi:peroxiredoxin